MDIMKMKVHFSGLGIIWGWQLIPKTKLIYNFI